MVIIVACAVTAIAAPLVLADRDRAAGAPLGAGGHPPRSRPTAVTRPRLPGARRGAGVARAAPVEAGAPAARAVQAVDAVVTIPSPAGSIGVPRSFLGISTEYWALPLFERHSALLARVLSLVRVPGNGPLVLRVGGDSADSTFWAPRRRRLPRWAFELTPRWFARTGSLLRQTGARLILDLNLVTDTPQVAAQAAAAARAALPRNSIVALEIGNEPDLYSHAYWQATVARAGFGHTELPSEISPASYVRDFNAYQQVLAKVAPHVPLVGPVTAYPALDLGWISSLLAGPHPGLGIVSAHLYPYSACAERGSAGYPTIGRLLSENATARLAKLIAPAVRLAHRAGLPLRLTELNSVTCGGLRGVSNTFATALWAPDALFELMRAGVAGVNVHVREDAINGAFALRSCGLIARPLLYGLVLFARTLGPGARLVQTQIRAPRPMHIKVWAVRVAGRQLHVLVIDKSNYPATVLLKLPANGAATVQRLLAPSAESTSGVTLDGRQLDSDARWRGQLAHETVSPGVDGYRLTVPGVSAALLSVHLSTAAGAPRWAREHASRVARAGLSESAPRRLVPSRACLHAHEKPGPQLSAVLARRPCTDAVVAVRRRCSCSAPSRPSAPRA